MSDRIAVLRDGRVEQVGTPEEIYERPATRFVATFIGRTNVLEATIARTGDLGLVARLDEGTDLALDSVHHASSVVESGTRVALCLREESLHFADEGPFAGVVTQLEFAGATTRYVVTTRVGDLRVSAPSAQRRPRLAERVHIAVSPSAGHVIHATA
jgi:ABC-type Fe3+/spermidine/putrescine transport system ATPase subunit